MPTSRGFTGQRADAVSGLDYYGARYYDPVAGQFTEADTAQDGLSPYAYVKGNPETLTDPTGKFHVCGTCGDGGHGGGSSGKGDGNDGNGSGSGDNGCISNCGGPGNHCTESICHRHDTPPATCTTCTNLQKSQAPTTSCDQTCVNNLTNDINAEKSQLFDWAAVAGAVGGFLLLIGETLHNAIVLLVASFLLTVAANLAIIAFSLSKLASGDQAFWSNPLEWASAMAGITILAAGLSGAEVLLAGYIAAREASDPWEAVVLQTVPIGITLGAFFSGTFLSVRLGLLWGKVIDDLSTS